MPTKRDGHIETNADWTIKSTNPSTPRDIVTEQKSATNQVSSKNKGSTNKEAPHQTTSRVNNPGNAVPSLDTPRVSLSQKAERHRKNERKGSGDLFGEKSVNAGARSTNKGSAPEHPEAKIASGTPKKMSYRAKR